MSIAFQLHAVSWHTRGHRNFCWKRTCFSGCVHKLGNKWSNHIAPQRTHVNSLVYMLFDDFANKLQQTLSNVSKLQVFGDKDFQKALNNVRMALIDADANVKIVDDLISKVETNMKTAKIPRGVTKTQMFVKLVHDGLVDILGNKGTAERILSPAQQQRRFMFVGLQGSGKTTTIAKFAKLTLKKFPKTKILLVACDTRRPAAIEQLDILGKRVNCETFCAEEGADAVRVLEKALEYSVEQKFDYVFVDTAGRQVIDNDLMQELGRLEKIAKPDETLLVLDAMTGQEAANVAKKFAETVHVSGAVLTKLDSDTRGGAALSLSTISGCRIGFMGTSEDLDGLEPFYPDRIASRILGMGDIVTLVEKAQENVSEEEAKEMAKRMMEAKFTFEDFLKQLSFVSSMGSVGNMLKMIPGVGNKINSEEISKMEKKLKVAKVIIQSMTKEEKKNPDVFYKDATSKTRIERIRKGSGRSQEEIDDFFKTFKAAQAAMKKLGAFAKKNGNVETSEDMESNDFTGNRAERRKLAKTKESVPKNNIKKGFGK
ncbi:hypothetical protein GAYE_SCF46G5811 [Galdieria yellowstonensis]|uniref:signal-recognition-particle GTPase n=1 Tax=Galdieria yellowstonensis TaxID=3028027 RepID=A0AAV9IKS7_9RHOD|nr:hypothetical protein GAYE_SCF46G5811 [Galdieria yellowstonensis]